MGRQEAARVNTEQKILFFLESERQNFDTCQLITQKG